MTISRLCASSPSNECIKLIQFSSEGGDGVVDVRLLHRWALPVELRYSDFPIAIGLRKNNRNIGLAKLSDFKYQTSKTGLPMAR